METVPAISLYELKFTSLIALRRLCFSASSFTSPCLSPLEAAKPCAGPVSLQIASPPLVISLCHWDGGANTLEALRFDQTGEEHSGLPF